MNKEREVRILLLGRTGAGKSRTGNTILGDPDAFKFSPNPDPGTEHTTSEARERFGRRCLVVDTPGVFHAKEDPKNTEREIKDSMIMLAPGPHAVLLCIPMQRFDKEEVETLVYYLKYFGRELEKYIVMVFTHYDKWKESMEDLGHTDPSILEYIAQLPEDYQKFVKSCRYVAFDNRRKGKEAEDQAKKLLEIIHDMVKRNRDQHFTNEGYMKIQEAKQMGLKHSLSALRDMIPIENKTIGAIVGGVGSVAAIAYGIMKK